jgi:hypothetical protein
VGEKTYRIFAVVPINQLRMQGDIGRGIKLTDTLLLSNNSQSISEYLNEDLRDYAGRADFNSFTQKGSVFAFAVKDVKFASLEHDVLVGHLNKILIQVVQFLSFLWIIRDTAAYPDCGYLNVIDGKLPIRVAKNYLGLHYSLASGGHAAHTIFSAEEIREIRKISSSAINNVDVEFSDELRTHELHKNIPNTPGQDRITRCRQAIEGARVSIYLTQKIAMYVASLETLFSTSSNELTYRLSERVAFFLGTTAIERRDLFERVKAAYTVRSSVVHGDTLPTKFRTIDALRVISTECDEILRKALFKIFSSKELIELFCSNKNDLIDAYFSKLIFSD